MPHASFEKLKSALQGFARRDEAGAILITGRWGVGKTHACLESLRPLKEEAFSSAKPKSSARDRFNFSYVSLYGVETADGIYSRIALGWQHSAAPEVPGWFREIGNVTGKAVKGVADIFNAGRLMETIGSSGVGLFVRNALIIIDDLERRDDKLTIDAVMGVASYLVESRNCRVIFISNEDALSEDDRKKFNSQKEKVFDDELEYSPTSEENVSLMAPGNGQYILPPAQGLHISNLRVIRAANRLLETIKANVACDHPATSEALLRNAAVLGMVHYGFRDKVDLTNRETLIAAQSITINETFLAMPTVQYLRAAGYKLGPADTEIVALLDTGYLDWKELNSDLQDRSIYFKRAEAEDQLAKAVTAFFRNFSLQEADIVPRLKTICEDSAEYIAPQNLATAAEILVEAGEPDFLDAWMKRWERFNLPVLAYADLVAFQKGHDLYPASRMQALHDELMRREGPPSIEKQLLTPFRDKFFFGDFPDIAALPDSAYDDYLQSSSENVSFVIRNILANFHDDYHDGKALIARKTLAALDRLKGSSRLNDYRISILKSSLGKGDKSTDFSAADVRSIKEQTPPAKNGEA